uniref:Uncharacterized protein n=1 Tax=Nelumbo nucifera TaxID=4432 RepID=A0A822Y8J9_NELNU|nr:TPA_asm: hypothetical protein HUJ06_029851 [Nelumbo nucifera]
MDLVLKLRLLCCNSIPTARLNMRRVLEFLKGEALLLNTLLVSARLLVVLCMFTHTTTQSSVVESLLSTGR